MLRFPRRFAAALGPAVLLAGLAVSGSTAASASQASCPAPIVPGDTVLCGALADGATYLMEVPPHWNKTLFLYSHGYVAPGSSNPAQDVGDPVTGGWLLSHGYAIAGSSYASTGWAIAQAMPDQIATLKLFDSQVGKPRRTIAWGHSLGGIITAGLIQRYPGRFSAALPMCGVLSGGVATWNTALDAAVAFQQLVDPSVQVVNITNPTANLTGVEQAAAAAQATAQGRARIALAAALGDTPGWYTPLSPQPAATNYAAQEANQYQWDANVDFPFIFAFRAELEARAGGNPSWTTGVNFVRQLAKSADLREVRALYKAAHLNLRADLTKLTRAARITAKPSAVRYLRNNISFNGRISMPVLTMHTTGDGLVVPENEQAYASVVRRAGRAYLLRQVFVSRAGHCAFTPAETITAARILLRRMRTGHWADQALRPASMNAAATALGPGYNIFLSGGKVVPAGPRFVHYEPAPYLRPYDLPSRLRR
ncbi:MAG: alpha/beta hydrolase family protein [Streptosporangiaceae bacterium]